jgi:diguanylate cyclase (GGDEF)-like protein/PAS domain S-box-containing protein
MTDSQGYVLIVDDIASNIQALFEILQASGFRAAVAKTAKTGIRQAQQTKPDLIVLDLILPDLHGFEACEILKRDPITRDIPVLFISSLDAVRDKLQAFQTGGLDYITKPLEPREVLARVKTHIALRRASQEILALNQGLEKRVQQRTAQLQAINQHLEHEIRERRQAQQDLSRSEEQFRLAFQSAPIGMAICDLSCRFIEVNQSLADTLGAKIEALQGKSWTGLIHPEEWRVSQFLGHWLARPSCEEFRMASRFLTPENETVYGVLQMTCLTDTVGGPKTLLSQFVDLTEQMRAEEQLQHVSYHDGLTNLANRTLLMRRLEDVLRYSSQQQDYQFAVLCIDLDRFKVINDSLGHEAGDRFLQLMAMRLVKLMRPGDTLARLGGDEFVVLMEPLRDAREPIQMADRIAEQLRSPLVLEGREVSCTASIGIVMSGSDYSQSADILRDADLAMYQAKFSGRACSAVFDPALHAAAVTKMQLDQDLRRAVIQQEFVLYYQPIVAAIDGKLLGFEALLRWQHPEQGWVSPLDFIPSLEENGLIQPVGEWVLRQACAQMIWWQELYPELALQKMNVNVSVRQLINPEFVATVQSILETSTVIPGNLQLEITESLLMENLEELLPRLEQLKLLGVCLVIDDFGTGYSSLGYLHCFPIDGLKIDRSFISRLDEGGKDYKITQTIIALAHQLGIRAIGEGVEEMDQWRKLQDLGCDEVQGYWFARPMDVENAEEFMNHIIQDQHSRDTAVV